MRLLVTRPEPDGERTAAVLRARGHDVLLASLLRMEAVGFEWRGERYSAVAMTSANAARAIARHPGCAELTKLPAFTVGLRTAQAAREAGFRDVRSADGDQGDLVALLRAGLGGARWPLLYLAGEDRAGDLAGGLGEMSVRTVVVYRAVAAQDFPPAVAAVLAKRELDGVLHFSRRSAQAYVGCAARSDGSEAALAPLHYCLSRQVAEPLAVAGAADIRIAPRPQAAALVKLVGAS